MTAVTAVAATAAVAGAVVVYATADDGEVAAPGAGVEVAALVAKGSEPRSATERSGALVMRLAGVSLASANAMVEEEVRGEIAEAVRGGGRAIALVEAPIVAWTHPRGERAARLDRRTEFGSPRVLPVLAQEGAWVEVMAPELDNHETAWVHAGALDVGGTDFSLRADLSRRRLEVREDGRVVRSMPVAIGGPATPTPTGDFAVTDKLNMSGADASYGCCALALSGRQPHVPQEWSGGDRLAVHATPHTETIGQAASLGCFRADEADARWLIDTVPLGTLIEIVD